MNSVEPTSSASWQTSQRHSGWAMTRMPGYCARTFSTCSGRKRWWTEQWPFQRKTRALADLLFAQPAHFLMRIPDHHLLKRNSHAVAGVAAQVLVGNEQAFLAARERPLHHLARVRRRAHRPAVPPDESLDRRRGVDVGDGHDLERPVTLASSSQQTSTCSRLAMSAIEQPAFRSGRITA